jgi:cytochrome c553
MTASCFPIAPFASLASSSSLVRWTLALCTAAAGSAAVAQTVPAHYDSMAERTRACTACHGEEGRATNDGYFPRIAGKPAGYLYNQLVNFREGRRSNATMSYFVEHMSDTYLNEIANHYAALDLPYPAPQPAAMPAEVLARGRTLAHQGDAARGLPACMQCHGERLTGAQPALPGLLGLPRDYLMAQLGAWQSGQRHAHKPDCMATIAQRLSPSDMAAVAAWLAAQPVPADSKPQAQRLANPPIACGSGW